MTLYKHQNSIQEFELIMKFLEWQNIPVKVCESQDIKYIVPVLSNEAKILGIGFFNIIKYFSATGLVK